MSQLHKLQFRDDIRLVRVNKETGLSEIDAFVKQTWQLEKFQVKYIDDENDAITLGSNQEFALTSLPKKLMIVASTSANQSEPRAQAHFSPFFHKPPTGGQCQSTPPPFAQLFNSFLGGMQTNQNNNNNNNSQQQPQACPFPFPFLNFEKLLSEGGPLMEKVQTFFANPELENLPPFLQQLIKQNPDFQTIFEQVQTDLKNKKSSCSAQESPENKKEEKASDEPDQESHSRMDEDEEEEEQEVPIEYIAPQQDKPLFEPIFDAPQPSVVSQIESSNDLKEKAQQLVACGFTNREQNLSALIFSDGDIVKAVNYLLSHQEAEKKAQKSNVAEKQNKVIEPIVEDWDDDWDDLSTLQKKFN